MSSIIKVGKVQSSTGQDAVTVADSGAITANGVLTATNIQTDSIKDDSGTRTLASDSGSAWSWGAGIPAGTVLQVVYADRTGKSNKSITTHSTYVDADLNTGTITQKQTGSKILVEACVTMAPSGFTSAFYRSGFFTWNTSSSGNYGGTNSQIVGKSVSAGIAEVDSHQYPATTGKWYVDTPSSSFTVYLTFYANAGSGTYVGGGNYHTSLTVYEIAQ